MLNRSRFVAAALLGLSLVACRGVAGMMRDECFSGTPIAEGVAVTPGSRATACVNVGDTCMGLSVLDPRSSPDRKGARVAYTEGCRMPGDDAVVKMMSASSCRKLVEFHLADGDPALVAFATDRVVAMHWAIRSDAEVAQDVAKTKASNQQILDDQPKTDWLGAIGGVAGAVAAQPNMPGANPKVMNTVRDVAKTTENVTNVAIQVRAATAGGDEVAAGVPASPGPGTAVALTASPASGKSQPSQPGAPELAVVAGSPPDAPTTALVPAVRSNDPACTAIAACNTSQKACNGGSADACAGLGGLYAYGVLGVTKDEAHGAALFLGACNANPSSPACIQLANLYASGTGVPKDKARALALSKRSCSAPKAVAAACSMVDSFGDHAYAIAHLRPLCDASDWSGCAYLMSDPAEKPHAIDRLHAMCSAGNTTACSHLKNMGL